MKKIILLLALTIGFTLNSNAQQDKSKRASPPDSVSVTTGSGVTISIHYSRPYLKGRDLATLTPPGKVWRTGANEATTFEINKDVKVNGKKLPAGKYSLYTIPGENQSTIIFNKTWEQWGTQYDQKNDVLRVDAPTSLGNPTVEQFTITADDTGEVNLLWGEAILSFKVE
ncbi:DUF2911 domain-containing protein [Albibacterium indicum]|uniref:DUF2911 domain-containing protein n=1 Tax=Albibacterium indicum TaxID=2292082 RepID=UPI000E4D4666|nr:DUF2911 domain-containing protein [Pedobacter indicus]